MRDNQDNWIGRNASQQRHHHDPWMANSPLADDAFMPSQFADLHRPETLTGEGLLLWALLEDAMRCYLGIATLEACTQPKKRHEWLPQHKNMLKWDAELWIFRNRGEHLKFEQVCAYLGIDPEYIRRELKRVENETQSTSVYRAR